MTDFEGKIEEKKQDVELKKQLRKKLPDCERRINQYLKEENREGLLQIFQEKEFQNLAQLDNTLAIFNVVLSIYHMETEENIPGKILTGIHSIQEAEERYLRLKFLMWRLEFRNEKEELQIALRKYQVSVPFLKYLVHTSSFEKANTAFKLAMLLKEEGHFAQAFGMLNYVNELSPDEELTYCEMADICLKNHKYREASECLGRIQNPSGILEAYAQKWGI